MADLSSQIDALLAESVTAAVEREQATFPALLQATDGGVVLFGAGRLGRLCARGLSRAGVPVRAVCDGNQELHGTALEGAEVIDPSEAALRFGGKALFVVAIWTGTARENMVERIAWLKGLGCRHVTTFAPLLWACGRDELPFHALDLPSRLLEQAEPIRRLAGLLGDDESRRVLLAALRQRLWGEFDDRAPAHDQYFPVDLVGLTDREIVADGGAFDGDTLHDFLRRTGMHFGEYHAFEPDPVNLDRLRERIVGLPSVVRERIHIHPVALHDRPAELKFANHGSQTSQVAVAGDVLVPGRTLDHMLVNRPVSFLKLDVEGAERSALNGALRILGTHRPVVAVCVYHGPSDLWDIPWWLHGVLPASRLFLRQHGFDGWETVCYAIPPERQFRSPPAGVAHRPCPVCASAGAREVLHRQRFFEGPLGDGYDVVVCANCGAGFADGIPGQEKLDRYYAERSKYTYAHAEGAESPYDFRRFEAIADQLEQHLPAKDARILDIGCATGGLLAVLKQRGYVGVAGSDPSPACAAAAGRLHGIEVRVATLAEHRSWVERFDAVVLVGVLEHVRDVREAVMIAAGLLKPAGVLYCAQPDVEAFGDCKNAPYQQFSTEHVNFFSCGSLVRLLGNAGLATQATWRWMVEWREGMTDSVVSGVFARGPSAAGVDRVTGPALRRYIVRSREQDTVILGRLERLVQTQEPVLVWGAGTVTRRLLASTMLAQVNIIAFVDANPALQEGLLAGRPVLNPAGLATRPETILICSQVFEAEIRGMICNQLRLANPIRSLFSPAT